MTNANAPNASESNTIRQYYGITMRPNENYLFMCNKKRIKYGMYCEEDQKTILQMLIDNARAKGLRFFDIFYEQTEVKNLLKSSLHFHACLEVVDKPTLDALKKYADYCNNKYKGSYIQFDYKELQTLEDQANWASYIRKDQKHSESVWTSGI